MGLLQQLRRVRAGRLCPGKGGGFHSTTYGLLRSGQSLTPFVLGALLRVPDATVPAPAGAVDRAIAFIRRHTRADGAVGVTGGDADYPNYATALAVDALVAAQRRSWTEDIAPMIAHLRAQQFSEANGWTPEHTAYGGWGMGGAIRRPPDAGHVDLSMTRFVLEALRSDAFLLRVNTFYEDLRRQMRRASSGYSDESREHVRDYVSRAKMFIEAVQRRNWTLGNIVQAIVRTQWEYLERGDAHLWRARDGQLKRDVALTLLVTALARPQLPHDVRPGRQRDERPEVEPTVGRAPHLRAAGVPEDDDAFEDVLDVGELAPGTMHRVSRGDLDVLLAHTTDGIVATNDRCPHMSAPLSIGELDGNSYASVVGALNVGLAYWLLLGWGVAPWPRRWLVIGFAFTTDQLFWLAL